MRHKSAKFWWATGGITLCVAALVGSFFVFSNYLSAHAAPKTTVAGESVAGSTREELNARLADQADAVQVTVTVDGQPREVSLADLGYTVDIDATVNQVFAHSDSLGEKVRAVFSSTNVEPILVHDPDTTQAFVESLTDEVGQVAEEASVTLDDTTGVFTATPAKEGKEIDASGIESAAENAGARLQSTTVELTTVQVEPEVTTARAEEVAKAANAIVTVPVTVSGEVTSHSATDAEKASWVKVTGADGRLTDPTIDSASVAAWVEATGESTNDKPQAGVRNVNTRGDVVSVISESVSGWNVVNTDELAEKLVESMKKGEEFDGNFSYEEVESDEWEDRLIAPGAEDLVYQAAKDEKWIDVNLSNFTMTAYEGATVVQGPVYMVPGAPATPTVTGEYKVYAKVASQTMRGPNADGTRYETPDVPDILYFYEGYALHGAYWRSSFGYGGDGGSHGCVNLPVDSAATLYGWAEVGTKVISHY